MLPCRPSTITLLWCEARRSLHAFIKVNLRSYVLLCHRFPLIGYDRIPSYPFRSWYDFPILGTTEYPHTHLAPCGLVGIAIPVWLIQQDKLTRAFLISQQAIPYWTHGGTCCSGVSTPKIWSLANSSTTCNDGIDHLHHFNHCSNHSIDLYHGHLTSQEMEDQTLSQRHKPTSISYKMKTCTTTNDYRVKQIY
jgi:hypothetical protein